MSHIFTKEQIEKAMESKSVKAKSKRLGPDGRLQDMVYHPNGTYKKIADEGDFYVYYNKSLDTVEFINGSREIFPSDESFGLKEYEKCFGSIERAASYYKRLTGKDLQM